MYLLDDDDTIIPMEVRGALSMYQHWEPDKTDILNSRNTLPQPLDHGSHISTMMVNPPWISWDWNG